MTDPARATRDQFLELYRTDLEAGGVRDLSAYQAEFPGFEAEIAAEFALLEDPGAEPDSGTPDPSPLAQTFGQYRILSELGRGGQAIVYLAEDSKLGRKVALKVLRAGVLSLGSADELHRFQREAEVSARLEHSGICSVYAAGEVDGTPYIAMRYVEGETLAQRVAFVREHGSSHSPPRASETQSGQTALRSETDRLLLLFEQCARALHFAHEQGLVHRDVKPGNIMVGEVGEPVLLDFGLARLDADGHGLTGTGALLGTPYYMAPEQVRGDARNVDRRTDVYALGVTMYEVFTLRRPHEAPSREALYRRILVEDPHPLRTFQPRLPADLQVVVGTAMAKEPIHRYQSAFDLAEDLRRIRVREPITAKPAAAWLVVWRWAQRRPAVALLLLLLTASVVTGVVLLSQQNQVLTRKVAEFTRLADLRGVSLLEQNLHDLRAYKTEHHDNLASFVAEARALLARAPLHEQTLARLADERSGDEQARAWQIEALTDLLGRLKTLREETLPLAEHFLDHVSQMDLRGEEHAARWRAAAAALKQDAGFAGFALTPQLGLVPLGPDPVSGKQEFAHAATGDVPSRGKDGRLQLSETSAMVFVLLPGGTFTMGARPPRPRHPLGQPNVDPDTSRPEFPPHKIKLAPFLIAKHEVTQSQWMRVAGTNPSRLRAGTDRRMRTQRYSFTVRHPVENVDYARAVQVLGRVGMLLPTEAQWEYAARAGTHTVWWSGNDVDSLPGNCNVADRAYQNAMDTKVPHDAFDDGEPFTAPVGATGANAFGLHEIIGNVAEWVLDEPFAYRAPPRPGDGLREDPSGKPQDKRVYRGGAWDVPATLARSARRVSGAQTLRLRSLGLRAVLHPK